MLCNWAVVLTANTVGAIGLAWLVLLSGHPANDGGAVARRATWCPPTAWLAWYRAR